MNDRDVGEHWEANAAAWTALSRAGHDVFRDYVNTPAFVKMLGDVKSLRGLDVGCGEGANTRTVARLGARMWAVDIAPTFVASAQAHEAHEPLGIAYGVANAGELPFEDAEFDFVTAFMSLMDTADYEAALREAHRVLRPGGFLQFSMIHPCFAPPHNKRITDENGVCIAMEVGNYFERTSFIEEWTFTVAPSEELQKWKPFRVPVFHRTLEDWLNLLVDIGFTLERVCEPFASEEAVRAHPRLGMLRTVALFLQMRWRKH